MENGCEIIWYEERILGNPSGAFGTVYQGKVKTRNGTDINAAVKQIERGKLEKAYKDKIAILKKLNHPNVVKLLHVEEHHDFIYLALELCNTSLDKVFLPNDDPKKYRGPLPSELDLMLQLSIGLDYIHSQDLIYRDIKPENVLISVASKGEIVMKWADFGFAKNASNRRGDFMMMRSGRDRGPEQTYWAPEIHSLAERDHFMDHKAHKIKMTPISDVFASGCVFFQFCNKGVHPYGFTTSQINMNLYQSNPMNLRQMTPEHWAFNLLKKMAGKSVYERPNLREIIPFLSALKRMASANPDKTLEEALALLEKSHEEMCRLCCRIEPTEEEIKNLTKAINEDSVGLVNIADREGYPPLLLLFRHNRSKSLHQCLKIFLIRPAFKSATRIVVDVNYQDRYGYNALHYLCMNYDMDDFIELFKLLTKQRIDMNRTDRELSRNALQLFLKHKRGRDVLEIVQLMVERGINIKHQTSSGWTALHYLCANSTLDNLVNIARFMVENGADATAMNLDGITAFHTLCENCNNINSMVDMVRFFIERGVDVNILNPRKKNVLHLACQYYKHNNLIDVAKLLIANGVNVRSKAVEEPNSEKTPLHALIEHYAQSNIVDIAKLLIENGADATAKTSLGWTPLHNACRFYLTQNNLIELIRLLIQHGADPNVKNSMGASPFHFLCRYYRQGDLADLIRLMIQSGADIHQKTAEGWSVLHFACHYYSHPNVLDVVRLLIDSGSEVNALEGPNGKVTALFAACRFYANENLTDLIRLLIELGADPSIDTSDGVSPLTGYLKYRNVEEDFSNKEAVVQILTEAGNKII